MKRTDIRRSPAERFFQFCLLFLTALAAYGFLPGKAFEVKADSAGFRTIDGKDYYIDASGEKHKGWLTLDGKKYYFDPVTGEQLKGWQYNESHEKIRYFTSGQGYMVTGYLTDTAGNTRYFNPSDGLLVRGWMKDSSGRRFYFTRGSGVMAKGWLTDTKGQKRYFSKADGRMLTGWQVSTAKNYRFFNTNTGVMCTGLTRISGFTYFFNKSTGIRFENGFKTVGKYKYYFIPGTGKAQTGWLTLNGKKYYFGPKGVMYVNRKTSIDGMMYSFDKKGIASESMYSYTIEGRNVKVYDPVNEKYYYEMMEFLEHPGILTGEVKDRDILAALCESEAGGQGLIGMEAVAMTVLNRTISPRKEFPSSVRLVVYGGKSFAQYSVVTYGTLLKKLQGQWYNRELAYEAADNALKIFNDYVTKGKPRTLEGFDRKDFNFQYFMTEAAFRGQPLNFSKVDCFLYRDHMFFVDYV